MCGVVGYVGRRPALPILLDGLKRLEYRGYDSAGVAVLRDGALLIRKRAGKVADLAMSWNGEANGATIGIAHTRWATHGEADDMNAHPHPDCHGDLAVIHNGIIENCMALRKRLESAGHVFRSQTDSETLAHLIEDSLVVEKDLYLAVRQALHHVEGTYGLVVLSRRDPDRVIVARNGSPLVIGYGDEEYLVASDAAALIEHTRRVVYLEDGEAAVISRDGVVVKTLNDETVHPSFQELTFDLQQIEKGYYPHFMLKEIYEQAETIENAMRGRLLREGDSAKLGGIEPALGRLRRTSRLIFTGCGTSWHAGLIGEYMIEQYAKKMVEVEYASEFRYRDPVVGSNDVVFLISQSGETADTLAALREARKRGAAVLGICNVVGSSIARECAAGVYTHAGPEIGVASTKAFTSQLTVLALITLLLARLEGLAPEIGRCIVKALQALPSQVRHILSDTEPIEAIAREFHASHHFLYLGRGYNFPVALEGALKLKEVAYVYAEGFPAAEIKHGPLALIDENMPVVVIAPQDRTYEKILNNIQEVKARRGRVIAIVNEPEERINQLADHLICVPHTLDMLTPILTIIPLQLLAYHIAVLRGYDVDQPRNLAKSVTVE